MEITTVIHQSEHSTKSAKLKRLEINLVVLSGIMIAYKQVQRHQVVQSCKNVTQALAGVAQWIEHWHANQRVVGSIPSQGTRLGCRPGPQ